MKHFAKVNKHVIKDYNFKLESLILLRNTRIEKDLDRKTKSRYLGSYVVVRRTRAESYEIVELDESISRIKVAAFRLIPYFSRKKLAVSIDDLLRIFDSDRIEMISKEVVNDANDQFDVSTSDMN